MRRIPKDWWLLSADDSKDIAKQQPEIIITIASTYEPTSAEYKYIEGELHLIVSTIQASQLFWIELNIPESFIYLRLQMQHIAGLSLNASTVYEGDHIKKLLNSSAAWFNGLLILPAVAHFSTIEHKLRRFANASGLCWNNRKPCPSDPGSLSVLENLRHLTTLYIRLDGQETADYSTLANLRYLGLEILRREGWIRNIKLPVGLQSLTVYTLHSTQMTLDQSDCSTDELLSLLKPASRLLQLTLINIRISENELDKASDRKLLKLLPDTLQSLVLFDVKSHIGLGDPHHLLTSLDVRGFEHRPSVAENEHKTSFEHGVPQKFYDAVHHHLFQSTPDKSSRSQAEPEPGSRLRTFSGPIARLQIQHPEHLRILRIQSSGTSFDTLARYASLEELELSALGLSTAAVNHVIRSDGVSKVLPLNLRVLCVIEIQPETVWHFKALSQLQELALLDTEAIVTEKDLPNSLILITLPPKAKGSLEAELQTSGRHDISYLHHLAVRTAPSLRPKFVSGFIFNEEIQAALTYPSLSGRHSYVLHEALKRLDFPKRRNRLFHDGSEDHAPHTKHHSSPASKVHQ